MAPAYSPNATTDPAAITMTTCTSNARTRADAGAPMARSNVSADAFWKVMITKNKPVTSGTMA